MHPILERPGRLVSYLAASLAVGVLLAGVLSRQGLTWPAALALLLPACLVYAFVCLSAWYVCLATPLRTSSIPRVLSASALAASIASGLWLVLIRLWSGLLESQLAGRFDPASYARQVPFLLTAGVMLYLLALAVHYAMLAFEATREAERRQLQLEVLARDAELRALRAQLDPHFLYNSLNSINALTGSDPAGARRMCLLLGDFLRQTLSVGARPWIPLADELALAERFLDIEQVRFGDRLRVERHADEAAAQCRVPPLLLQPLVENAVTHGIANVLEGGVIRLDIVRRDGRVSIAIENPRDADGPPPRHGIGLENVRQRIGALFGDAGRVEARAEGDRFRVDLDLPCVEND